MTQPQIVTIPCLSDNYAFLLHDPETGATACVDVPDAAPILAELSARSWTLSDILITHHHWDHVQGVEDLVEATGAKVWGSDADAARLPPLDHRLIEGDNFNVGSLTVAVLDVSGHCDNHLAFHVPAAKAAFTADSLMALGCGRLFEGTAEQMWGSLSKLAALPADTWVYSGHEYTESNARFALTIEPDNPDLLKRVEQIKAARADGKPTVPSELAQELATNPFLRAAEPGIASHLGLVNAPPAHIFREIRARKDSF
ncbi:hydroxyacylglutathione hydrolase [Gymnodinialimonas sp. 2305UL16-5]|uniref:hydroxyacylglutathione hydrolase n=1 Tax=Gymnodinialimonas mytili TaxID=3126503 RepID=UPI0030A8A6E1